MITVIQENAKIFKFYLRKRRVKIMTNNKQKFDLSNTLKTIIYLRTRNFFQKENNKMKFNKY